MCITSIGLIAVPKTTITGMGWSQFLQKFLIRICLYFWCFVFMQILFYHSTPPSGLNFKHLLPIWLNHMPCHKQVPMGGFVLQFLYPQLFFNSPLRNYVVSFFSNTTCLSLGRHITMSIIYYLLNLSIPTNGCIHLDICFSKRCFVFT